LTDQLGPRHAEVRRLRALLRDRRVRAAEDAFVLEGPRVVEGALDRGVSLEAVYLGAGTERAFPDLVERVRAQGARVAELKEGVLEKVATTRTPQPVLGVAKSVVRPLAPIGGEGTVVVAVGLADPGNLGTIVRSAEAAGADAVVTCGNSVDVQNPKVVRSSAGAIFGVNLVEGDDPVAVLESLAAGGRRVLGARPGGGDPYDTVDLAHRCAVVVGNEARGLEPEIERHLSGHVSIPMATGAESLNVAMAATLLLFESARQRRAGAGTT
jgi:RNA methyltransferase, TrmH family